MRVNVNEMINKVLGGFSPRRVIEGAVGSLDLDAIAHDMNKFPGSKVKDQGDDGVLITFTSPSDAREFHKLMIQHNMDPVVKSNAVLVRPVSSAK